MCGIPWSGSSNDGFEPATTGDWPSGDCCRASVGLESSPDDGDSCDNALPRKLGLLFRAFEADTGGAMLPTRILAVAESL